MGSDFAYECLGNGKYRIILNLYRDCNGINLQATENYRYKCKGSGGSTQRTAKRISTSDVTGINAACGIISKCGTGSNFAYGIQQHVYVDTVNFSSLSCCEVTVYYDVCCRNGGISTGSAGQNFYSDMTINKCLSACNSSPKYTNYPVAIVCKDQDVTLNSGASDTIDVGDSLSYELTTSLVSATGSVSYSGSFSYLRPLSFLGFPTYTAALPSGFHLNPVTGDLAFRPTVLNQMSVVAFKVKEWRKDANGTWQIVGESRRDLQVIVINCVNASGAPNSLPTLPTIATAQVCSGDSVCVRIIPHDSNSTDTVRLSWNNGIAGAQFFVANPGKKIDTAYVCWRPAVRDTSSVPYAFTITALDNACPFPGGTTRAFSIKVGLKPETQMEYSVDTCGLVQMRSIPLTTYIDPLYTWILKDATGDTVFRTASAAKNAFAFVDPGKYYVYHSIATSFPCASEFYDSFTVAPYPVIRTSLPSDTSVCQFSPISLNSTVQGGVAPLLYSWNTSSIDTNTSKSLVIEHDSMLVITVSDKFGCYHRDTVFAYSLDLPENKISIQQKHQCFSGNSFEFYDSSSIASGSLTRLWYLGEGDTSSTLSLTKSFATHDTFQIRLFTYSNLGCLDTAYDSVWVHPQSVPGFSIDDTIQCFRDNAFTFNAAQSSNPYEQITGYYWDHGDTTGDTASLVYKSYLLYGDRSIRLITETESGCLDTLTRSIRVDPQASLKISLNDSLFCLKANSLVANASLSTLSDGFISEFHWDWGDLSQDTGSFPQPKVYAMADTFRINLLSISNKSCRDSIWQKIVIHPQANARFTADTQALCLKANSFSFDASGTTLSSGSIAQYSWAFGDGNLGTGMNSTHSYASFDTFSVFLYTNSGLSCKDTFNRNVIVHPQANLAFISNQDDQCLNLNSFSFDAAGSTIPWGTLDSLYWDFGNSIADTGWFIDSVVYMNEGQYAVRLRTVSYFGCRDTLVIDRTVHPRAIPVIQANYPDHCLSGNAFLYDALLSSVPTGMISQYDWLLSDGNYYSGIQPATHSYGYEDSFEVRLITQTDKGCLDTAYTLSVVHPQPASFLFFNEDKHCLSGHGFFMDASGSQISSGNIAVYAWNFGDGNTQLGPLVTNKTFTTEGSYLVKLRTESGSGCADSLYHTFIVHPQMKPAINVVDSFVCVRGNFFTLNAASSTIPYGAIQAYEWNFDDGNFQSGIAVNMKNYAYYDTFNLKLKTISDKACTDSIFRRIVVYPQPTAKILVNDSIQCFDSRQSFDLNGNTSSVPSPWAGIVEYDWISDDGDAYTGPFWMDKDFLNRGLYTIRLKVRTFDGCLDSVMQQVHFYPAMLPSFTTPDTAQCFNEHGFIFNATSSSIPLGSIDTITWKYGDQSEAVGLLSPNKRFASFDTFGVWMITTSNEWCKDSTYREVIVFESPLADFEVDETCLKQASLFQDKSVVTHDALVSWDWTFGDGNGDTLQNPVHYYSFTGLYDVRLQVNTENSCSHDTLIPGIAIVKTLPRSDFTFARVDYDFETVDFEFYDKSLQAIQWRWDFGHGGVSTLQHPDYIFQDTLHYLVTLIVQNTLGCEDTSARVVWAVPEFLIYVPNAFTPNQDRLNEGFAPRATPYYRKYSMTIVDRWGEVVFQTDRLDQSWDGTYKGISCSGGVYLYVIDVVDHFGERHHKKGTFTLIR